MTGNEKAFTNPGNLSDPALSENNLTSVATYLPIRPFMLDLHNRSFRKIRIDKGWLFSHKENNPMSSLESRRNRSGSMSAGNK